jgi:hypothetical protein
MLQELKPKEAQWAKCMLKCIYTNVINDVPKPTNRTKVQLGPPSSKAYTHRPLMMVQ